MEENAVTIASISRYQESYKGFILCKYFQSVQYVKEVPKGLIHHVTFDTSCLIHHVITTFDAMCFTKLPKQCIKKSKTSFFEWFEVKVCISKSGAVINDQNGVLF